MSSSVALEAWIGCELMMCAVGRRVLVGVMSAAGWRGWEGGFDEAIIGVPLVKVMTHTVGNTNIRLNKQC